MKEDLKDLLMTFADIAMVVFKALVFMLLTNYLLHRFGIRFSMNLWDALAIRFAIGSLTNNETFRDFINEVNGGNEEYFSVSSVFFCKKFFSVAFAAASREACFSEQV